MKPQTARRLGAALDAVRRYVAAPLILVAVLATAVPLIGTNAWWVRYLDFPRLQVAGVLVVLVALWAISGGWRARFGFLVVALALLALGYQGYRLYHYAPDTEKMAKLRACPAESRLRVMVANVQKSNEHAGRLFRIVDAADPDVVLFLETDAWWDGKLEQLSDTYPHSVESVPEGHAFYGMHLLSRYPLSAARIRFFFGGVTPTIQTDVQLPDGTSAVFFGLHPPPPQWSQPTTLRDGHLMKVALEAARSEQPVVVAGDFNATPWESVNRRAMRLGRLLDPRVGRGLYPSYGTGSLVISWPLDQVLFQQQFAVNGFRMLPSFGSDHYPVLATLCHNEEIAEEQKAPAFRKDDPEAAKRAILAARAAPGG